MGNRKLWLSLWVMVGIVSVCLVTLFGAGVQYVQNLTDLDLARQVNEKLVINNSELKAEVSRIAKEHKPRPFNDFEEFDNWWIQHKQPGWNFWNIDTTKQLSDAALSDGKLVLFMPSKNMFKPEETVWLPLICISDKYYIIEPGINVVRQYWPLGKYDEIFGKLRNS